MNRSSLPLQSGAWRVGRRVVRRDGKADAGTIVESNHRIKVKWDSGATSYFARGKPGNVVLTDD
jgi:hypothetical protein